MRTTHDGPIGMLTVVGHSYGSTTTGLALQRENLDVDQVVLIGSPGVGGEARTVADLGLDRSQVFVGSARRDPVTTFPDSLGEDPSEEVFGATRFKAESVERSWHTDPADHSPVLRHGQPKRVAVQPCRHHHPGTVIGWVRMACWPNRVTWRSSSGSLTLPVTRLWIPRPVGPRPPVMTTRTTQEGPAHELTSPTGSGADRRGAAARRHRMQGQHAQTPREHREDTVR
jgi:pimeloyl-ACP methyl ester carboxylesterase